MERTPFQAACLQRNAAWILILSLECKIVWVLLGDPDLEKETTRNACWKMASDSPFRLGHLWVSAVYPAKMESDPSVGTEQVRRKVALHAIGKNRRHNCARAQSLRYIQSGTIVQS
jgi:hypothetical protein